MEYFLKDHVTLKTSNYAENSALHQIKKLWRSLY